MNKKDVRFSWPLGRKERKAPSASSRRARARVQIASGIQLDPVRLAIAAGTAGILCVLLSIHLWPSRVNLKLGEVSPREIVAQRTVRFLDSEATRRARSEAAQDARKYTAIPNATPAALQRLHENLQRELVFGMQDDDAQKKAEAIAERLVTRAMSRAIRNDPDELQDARRALRESPEFAPIAPDIVRSAVVRAASEALSHNLNLDSGETDRAQQEAQQSVKPIYRRFAAGQTVIRANEPVTQFHLDAFGALGLQNAKIDATSIAMVCVLVLMILTFVASYLRLFQPQVYQDRSRLLLLSILTIISVLGLKVGSTLLGLPVSGGMIGYLAMMCVTSAGMVISGLVRPSIAVLVVSLLSAVSGLILNNEVRFSLLSLGSAYSGIVACATLRNRTDLLRALGILCGSNAILIGLIGQLQGDLPQEQLSGMLWGVISGAFALFLYYVGTAAFERLFGITTNLRLLELSDPATPILQEMRMKVPGTYAHSLMVGTLAHAAAEAIGADSLLARVAAYYHDLGKMNRPEFFIENQANAENVHDRIAPTLSALILVSHVKEGVEIAQSIGIPPLILEVMEQHHGTSLMRYFYYRATGGIPDSNLESQFRYPGPKPRRKEAAILMLADTVEAASRTLQRPTPQRIADFVEQLIEEKRADGQLDECELTLNDISVIQGVFVRTLAGTLHARIEYPSLAKDVLTHGTTDSDRQSGPSARPDAGRIRRIATAVRRRKP